MDLTPDKLDSQLQLALLIDLIEVIRKAAEKSIFFDKILPLLITILIAFITVFFTHKFTKKQQDRQFKLTQNIDRENRKIGVINHTVLLAESCFTKLLSIKDNYRGSLSKDYPQRIMDLPEIIAMQAQPVDLHFIDSLTFLLPKNDGEDESKWRQISQVHALFFNYNHLLAVWEKRNMMRGQIEVMIFESEKFVEFLEVKNDSPVPFHLLMKCAQLTEYVIKLTDDLTYQFSKFLSEFPVAAHTCLRSDLDKELLIEKVHFPEDANYHRLSGITYEMPGNMNQLLQKVSDKFDTSKFEEKSQSPYRKSRSESQ